MKTLGSIAVRAARWLALGLPVVLAACGGGSDSPAATGTLRLALTDAPACGYQKVFVTVDRVRVHKSGTAPDVDSGWSEIVLNPSRRVDLLTLTNGVLEELGQTALPAGRYTQMRLVLAPNSSASPLANSVMPTGGAGEMALTTPSGQQTGLKMNVDIDVQANQIADFVIDFDACKSVVRRGNSGQYNLKPVMAVSPRFLSGVIGYVDPDTKAASVSLQASGVPLRSTTPDAGGRFVLPVAPGTYDLVISGGGRVTGVMTDVPVTDNIATAVNGVANAIGLGSGTYAALSGEVSVAPPVSPIGVFINASQTLTSGKKVEVVARQLDTAASSPLPYSLEVPVNAPVFAPYSPTYATSASAVPFVADAASAVVGKYSAVATVTQAASAPLVKSSPTVSVPASGVNFAFP